MSTVNASGKVIGVSEADDGAVTVTLVSARALDNGQPSFKLTYEFPAGSAAIAAYPLDTLVTFAITTTPPVEVPAAPAADQITTTQSLSSSSGPEAPETPVEAPVVDPAAPVEQTPAEAPVTEPAPVEADVVPLVEEPPVA